MRPRAPRGSCSCSTHARCSADVPASGSTRRSATTGASTRRRSSCWPKARALATDVAAVALGPGARGAVGQPRRVRRRHGLRSATTRCTRTTPASRRPTCSASSCGSTRRSSSCSVRRTTRATSPAGCRRCSASSLVANVDDVLAVDRVRLSVALSPLARAARATCAAAIGGAKHVEVVLDGPRRARASRAAGAFAAEPCGGAAEVVDDRRRRSRPSGKRVRRLERHEERSGERLEDARVVVAGGRGLGARELRACSTSSRAAIGDAAVGATRPVVDAGWAPFARQIGQTGKTVQPRRLHRRRASAARRSTSSASSRPSASSRSTTTRPRRSSSSPISASSVTRGRSSPAVIERARGTAGGAMSTEFWRMGATPVPCDRDRPLRARVRGERLGRARGRARRTGSCPIRTSCSRSRQRRRRR